MSQSSSRKSSLGTGSRRGPQKAHIPYRGDDLEHGKKTGKTVNQVSRDADDFEPFEQVLDQAYKGGDVPRPVNNRAASGRSRREYSPVHDDGDDSGELSMDIDSTHNSPSVYFNTATAPQPSSAKRVGSSSRPLPRGSNVDYDRVPSPQRVPRHNPVHSGKKSLPLYPSRLRKEIQDDDDGTDGVDDDAVVRGPTTDHEDGSFATVGIDDGEGTENYLGEDYSPGDSDPSPNSRGNLSFTALAQEEEDNLPENKSPVSSRGDKGKGRAEIQESAEEDADIEEDIAVGLQEIEDAYGDSGKDEPGPSKKKPRGIEDNPRSNPKPFDNRSKKPQTRRTKEKPRISTYETLDEDGLRRSQRRHYPPLEYWRQERVVWGRRKNGRSVVPVIKEIITIPKPTPEPLGGKKRKRGRTHAPRSQSKSYASPNPVEEVHVVEVENPERGWDDNTSCDGIILDWHSQQEVKRRVAYTAKMITPQAAQANRYSFQKVFGDGNFVAAGQVIIPRGEEKPMKPAKDNTYIFYVIEGAVECKVHRSSFVLATGGMFLVPRGNTYYIKNICEREVKIFFTQARKIQESDQDVMPDILSRADAPSRPRTAPRSSSHGISSPKQSLVTQDTGTTRLEKT